MIGHVECAEALTAFIKDLRGAAKEQVERNAALAVDPNAKKDKGS